MIIITRHGQTDWNIEKKVMGKIDISINNNGIEQAKKTKNILKEYDIDLIICSPLKRARMTAEIINERRNIEIIYDDRISERDFGEFEGKKSEEFDFQGFWSYKQNCKYELAENIEKCFLRVYDFLNYIKKTYSEKNILIVTHGGISIIIKCYFEGIPENDNLLDLVLENCEIYKCYI